MFKEKLKKTFRKFQTTGPDQFKKDKKVWFLTSWIFLWLPCSTSRDQKYGQNSQQEDAQCEPEPLA